MLAVCGWLLTFLGAIIASLAVIKDKPLDKWPSGLTIVNVLSKVASAALILPISEAIGQLKWSWFYGKRSRDANDFEIFDKASRGAWGSLLLLCRTKGRSLAALGALLTLLLLAIDTFFQQATDLPARWTLNGMGLVPRVVRYEPHYIKEFLNGDEGGQSDSKVLAVADTYFLGNGTQPVAFGNGTRPDIPLTCPTSSCTWPPYETLGICSHCTDASRLLTYACIDTRIDWTSELNATTSSYPNSTVCGHFLNATSEDPILMSGFVRGRSGAPEGETLIMRTLPLISNPLREALWGGSVNFKNFRDPIVDVLISSNWNKADVHANKTPVLHECALNWCVKTIESSYLFGTYLESVTNIRVNDTKEGGSPWSTFTYDDGSTDQTYHQNVTISVPSTDSNISHMDWGVSNVTMVKTVLIFDRLFPAFTTVANDSERALLRWRLGHPTEVRTRLLDTNPWLLPGNITRHFERLAMALTNAIRSDSASGEPIAGDAFSEVTYVAVHWEWLSFPLVMLGLSIIFLIATIVKTSRDRDQNIGIWKTSAMPTLIYSLPQDMRHTLATASTWKSTKSDGSKGLKIRLIPNRGWRVSEQLSNSISTARPATTSEQ
jgi:hypothetical protein